MSGQVNLQRKNKRMAFGVIAIVVGMLSLAYASVPLYRLFCQVTGFGGTPVLVEERGEVKVSDKRIKIRFNADVASGLTWDFKPDQREISVLIGEDRLATYTATNRGASPVVGTATFNVTPMKAAPYFNKIDCFCFTEQALASGEQAHMPVSFFVDPAILDDENTLDVNTITLSYTFFEKKKES